MSRTVLLLAAFLMVATGVPARAAPVQSLYEARTRAVVLQQYDLSCGAAALATLLRYQHGLPLDEKTVALGLIRREEYLDDPGLIRIRQGFSLFDMKRYTDSTGLLGVAEGGLVYEDLPRRAPAIVPILLHGYSHFVVFRGQVGDEVLLADPAWGNRRLGLEAFRNAWIDYADFGKVAFTVQRRDGLLPPDQLSPVRTGRHDFSFPLTVE